MASVESTQLAQDTELAKHALDKVVEDLAMLLDRPLVVESVDVARSANKVAGERQVHIAFKLGVTIDGVPQHGALLVPLAEAITFACYLMMMTDEVVTTRRMDKSLERGTKDAMVEVGNLIGGSIDGAFRDLYPKRTTIRSEGCQGVKPAAAPAFERTPGVDLIVARAKLKLHTFPAYEALLMLPVIPSTPPPAA
jgi:hypothetical protein